MSTEMTQRTANEVRAAIKAVDKRMDETSWRSFIDPADIAEIHRLRAELAAIERTQDERAG